MKLGILKFDRVIQNTQVIGGEDEHMVAELHCELNVDGTVIGRAAVTIKQTVGSDYQKDPLEVSLPKEGKVFDAMDFQTFRAAAEHCYRSLIGPDGLLSMRHGSLAGNIIVFEKLYPVPLREGSAGW